MKKILIIGQAPPAVKQRFPYDTTMLYDWLKACNITIDEAQELFEFEAVSNVFPGFGEKGHKQPSTESMNSHWPVLLDKINNSQKIWVLGNVAKKYLTEKLEGDFESITKKLWLFTIHPSKRNWYYYTKNKEILITSIKNFIHL